MPLLPVWAFVACYRVNFTFTFTTALWYITRCHLVDRYQGLEESLQKPCSGQKNKQGGKGRCKCREDGTGTGAMDGPTNRPRSHVLIWYSCLLFCSSFGSFNVHHLVLCRSHPRFLSTFRYVYSFDFPSLAYVCVLKTGNRCLRNFGSCLPYYGSTGHKTGHIHREEKLRFQGDRKCKTDG
jgi:hypothetical protein